MLSSYSAGDRQRTWLASSRWALEVEQEASAQSAGRAAGDWCGELGGKIIRRSGPDAGAGLPGENAHEGIHSKTWQAKAQRG